MAKRIFLVLAVSIFLLSFLADGVSAKELKIGYIDMQKVFTEYNKTKKADADLEGRGKVKTDQRKKMVDTIRRLKDEMELLSEKGKEGKQAEIDEKIQELQEFDRSTRDELIGEREDIIRGISKDIDDVISTYGKKNGYDLILNKDRRVLLYEKEGLDVTEDIIKTLNR